MKEYVKASILSGLVGIWWIHDGQIVADTKTLDEGYNDGSFIHYDDFKNHATEWKRLISEYLPEVDVNDGYKSIERGRVVFNIRTRCYEIICSEAISKDADAIDAIIQVFDLKDSRYDIIANSHYHIAKLTGNPALDRFEYET